MMKYIDRHDIPTDKRPLGYWLRAIEVPLRHAMREAFASFGVTRREWRTLTTLHAGPATAAEIEAALPPRREHGRAVHDVLDAFVNRGWATSDGGGYTLTADGERVHDAILANVQKVRARVTADIPDADYATTMATLEKIAGNVGFDPAARRPMRHRGPQGHVSRA
ncbi:MAG: MarR family winged helix-turn-helix transcriptional regulator [Microbacteriaceae bacterium]